jgi:hypothetical protein
LKQGDAIPLTLIFEKPVAAEARADVGGLGAMADPQVGEMSQTEQAKEAPPGGKHNRDRGRGRHTMLATLISLLHDLDLVV